MKNLPQIFKFKQNEVRTVKIENGETEFVAIDVAEALGYKDPNKAIKAHCKGWAKRPVLTEGGIQQLNTITESNLYRLVAHSKLPSAEKFEAWIFEKVIPSIRKHGGYIDPNATTDQINALQSKIRILKAEKHNEIIEKKHYMLLSEQYQGLAETWQSKAKYGEVSRRNGLPKLKKRRGAWCADPRGGCSIRLNELQGTFEFID